MTTKTDIASLVAELAAKQAEAKRAYAEAKELEFELIGALKDQYPAEWLQWQRGVQSFKAESVEIPLKRQYDANKVQAEFGEDMPHLVEAEHEETVLVPVKANGRAIAPLWRDAALARRLEKCLLPQEPRVVLR